MSKNKYILITGCSKDKCWYKENIGNLISGVIKEYDDSYTISTDQSYAYVDKQDGIPVTLDYDERGFVTAIDADNNIVGCSDSHFVKELPKLILLTGPIPQEESNDGKDAAQGEERDIHPHFMDAPYYAKLAAKGMSHDEINANWRSENLGINRTASPAVVSEDAPKEKKWTDEDMEECWQAARHGTGVNDHTINPSPTYRNFDEYIQSLQSK